MPQLTIYITAENMRHVHKLREAEANISRVCREAIVAKSEELDAEPCEFAVGDEVIIDLDGWYCDGHEGTVMGILETYLKVLLPDRTLGLFEAHEMKHREEGTP